MVEGDERPVRDHAGHALPALEVVPDDQVLHRGRVHHDDIRHSQDLRENSRSEQGRVLHHDEGTLVLKGHAELGQEAVGRLANDLDTANKYKVSWTAR